MELQSSAKIYASYDRRNPPEHPGAKWTRFVCISDTHSHTSYEVPPGDVLLHAGDLSSWGYYKQIEKTIRWIQAMPHPIKVIIAGNHDLGLDEHWRESNYWHKQTGQGIPSKQVTAAQKLVRGKAVLQAGIHYLEYEPAEITLPNGRTWRFYGSPAASRYALGAFQYDGSEEADLLYDKIPRSTEILLTHTPPHGIHDVTKKGANAGCRSLSTHLQNEQLASCRLHVFGHIHEGFGASIWKLDNGLERVHVNAAIPHSGMPIIVDLLN